MTLAGLAFPGGLCAAIDSTFGGVHVGAQTYSFRDLPQTAGGDAIDNVIKALVECGIGECELFAPQVEPAFGRRGVKAREDLRRWRLETPLDHFRAVRKKFDAAGIAIYAYNYSPNASFTDAEIERGFEMTQAPSAPISSPRRRRSTSRKRLAPFAEQHKMVVGHARPL